MKSGTIGGDAPKDVDNGRRVERGNLELRLRVVTIFFPLFFLRSKLRFINHFKPFINCLHAIYIQFTGPAKQKLNGWSVRSSESSNLSHSAVHIDTFIISTMCT